MGRILPGLLAFSSATPRAFENLYEPCWICAEIERTLVCSVSENLAMSSTTYGEEDRRPFDLIVCQAFWRLPCFLTKAKKSVWDCASRMSPGPRSYRPIRPALSSAQTERVPFPAGPGELAPPITSPLCSLATPISSAD